MRRILALALLAAAPALAQAAPIDENLSVVASGFADLDATVFGGTANPAPVDPLALTFGISFDPGAGNQFGQTAGIRLLRSGTPVGGPISFSYDSAGDQLVLGGAGLAGVGITEGTDDILLVIDDVSTAPSFAELTYTTLAGPGIFDTLTGSVTVPEPVSLALLSMGAGLLALRRRPA